VGLISGLISGVNQRTAKCWGRWGAFFAIPTLANSASRERKLPVIISHIVSVLDSYGLKLGTRIFIQDIQPGSLADKSTEIASGDTILMASHSWGVACV